MLVGKGHALVHSALHDVAVAVKVQAEEVAPGVGVGKGRAFSRRVHIRMVDGTVTARVHLVNHLVKEGVDTAALLFGLQLIRAGKVVHKPVAVRCASQRRDKLLPFARYVVNGLAAQHG
ncbi:hypothetical protein SDC9_180927 [bioreactor metagenome]|uniref:Uncharacterized protein n=1 Tax=bioreactor metagenome TaxID=1076179 RepID=A0A645H405_9ZZZZ